MKNIFVIIIAMFLSSALYAQVHVNVNLGGPLFLRHPGYNSHRVIVYHPMPLRYHVIYRDRYYDDRDSRIQKHDNGKHNGWYKGNNGNGNGNDRGNENGYYNDNNNGNYNGNDNDNGYYKDNSNGNGNYNGNNNDNGYYKDNSNGNGNGTGNNEVPDKYPYK